MALTQAGAARLLLMKVAPDSRLVTDPVEFADRRTSLADARALLCMAHGVDPADITGLGYEHTRRAYDEVRASWIHHIEGHGWHDASYIGDPCWLADARACWADFLEPGDNWLDAGWVLHLARYPSGCSRENCDLCHPVTELPEGYHADTLALRARRVTDLLDQIDGGLQ